MRFRAGLGLVICEVLLAGCSASRDSFSNAEARASIEKYWNTLVPDFVLGQIVFVVDREDHSKGRVSLDDLWMYEDMVKAGVLSLTDERDLTKNFGGWNDFFALSQNGVRRTATTSLTDRGKAIGKPQPVGGFEQIAIPLFTYDTQDIVANDTVPSAVDTYRLVLATYAFGIRPEFGEVLKVHFGNGPVRERRLKILLTFEPFEKKWDVVAADHFTTGAKGFDTDRVGRALQGLKVGS
jgi:hypothetical protein